MGRLVALALIVLALPLAAASEPYQTVIDWEDGHFVASTRLGIDRVDFFRFPFALDACHRSVLVDLLYSPEELGVDAEGIGAAALLYEFRAEVWTGDGETMLSSARIRSSGFGHPADTMPAAGAYELRLFLVTGVEVDWSLRVRAREVIGDIECLPRLMINEVEADPPGADAGAEWVELYNPRDVAVDASGWTLGWGAGSVALPEGTLVPPGARIVVAVPSGIPNADAVVSLTALFGYTSDETPPLTDASDDKRTWQRSPDGGATWVFAQDTRDAANG